MVFSPSIGFIDAALTATGDRALSVPDKFKWLIRRDLLALLSDFPALSPDSGTFTHDDGTLVNLLYVHGELPLRSSPAVLLTIWLPESYPMARPMVYVFPKPSAQLLCTHPLVDPSGLVATPYLVEWQHPKSNLSELIRNLVRLLDRHNRPNSLNPSTAPSHLPSRREAMDRLASSLCLEKMQFHARAKEDIEHLSSMQEELRNRGQQLKATLRDLRNEWLSLKKASKNKEHEESALALWLQVHSSKPPILDEALEAFEAADERSRRVLDDKAVDLAIDDVLYVLDEALSDDKIPLAAYLKLVRALAREQFICRVSAEEAAQP